MVEPVLLDGHVHPANLPGEAVGRDVQVAERRRDVPDLVTARGDARRQLAGRQHPRSAETSLSGRVIDRHNMRPRPATGSARRGAATCGGRPRCPSRSAAAVAASSPAVSRSSRRSPRIRVRGPPATAPATSLLHARRIADHHLPHAVYGGARRLGQHRVELADERSGGVLAEGVERTGLHDDPAHAHRLRPPDERGGLRDALHLGRLDRLTSAT